MKIIHTSDWHLGRSFGPVSLQPDQERFVDWFVDLVRDEDADLVVIAGDLYDRAVAPKEAIGLFRDAVGRLLDTGTVVAAITGNHDGADRVAPYSDLLDGSRFYLRGGYDRVGDVLTHDFADGSLDIVLLPYLDPRAAPDGFGFEDEDEDRDGDGQGEDADPSGDAGDGRLFDPDARISSLLERRGARTHQTVLHHATERARRARRSGRSIAVAHAFVTGGSVSDSERQLVVGGTGSVAADVFDGFDYVALGHLHRPQRIGADHLRYSGTPLPYSFSEDHEKSVAIVELAADGSTDVRLEPVPVGRAVRTIEGSIDDLLDPTGHPDAHDAFVRAVVTDRQTVLDARARLATVYPHVVEVRLMPGGRPPEALTAPEEVSRLEPIDAVRTFWEAIEGSPPPDEIDELLRDATTRALEAIDR